MIEDPDHPFDFDSKEQRRIRKREMQLGIYPQEAGILRKVFGVLFWAVFGAMIASIFRNPYATLGGLVVGAGLGVWFNKLESSRGRQAIQPSSDEPQKYKPGIFTIVFGSLFWLAVIYFVCGPTLHGFLVGIIFLIGISIFFHK